MLLLCYHVKGAHHNGMHRCLTSLLSVAYIGLMYSKEHAGIAGLKMHCLSISPEVPMISADRVDSLPVMKTMQAKQPPQPPLYRPGLLSSLRCTTSM